MKELEKKLKHSFKDKTLLQTALSHSSFVNENKGGKVSSNERLEFLGDSVLGQVVAHYLYQAFPKMPEGQMSRLRAELVCEQSLFAVAVALGLGEHIKLGKGEESSGGRQRPSILADAVEAIIAALYLDGGVEVAKEFVESYILSGGKARMLSQSSDYKTSLQELVQRAPGQSLSYETVSESGPDHDKTFMVRVLLNGKPIGDGSGRTKKEAEQSAAGLALEELSR